MKALLWSIQTLKRLNTIAGFGLAGYLLVTGSFVRGLSYAVLFFAGAFLIQTVVDRLSDDGAPYEKIYIDEMITRIPPMDFVVRYVLVTVMLIALNLFLFCWMFT